MKPFLWVRAAGVALGLSLAGLILAGLTACAGAKSAGPEHKQQDAFEAAWQALRDSYFYTNFHGLNWPAIHDELAPRAARARTPQELRPVLEDMLGRLGRSHLGVIPAADAIPLQGPGGKGAAGPQRRGDGEGTLGLEFRLVETNLLVTGVAPGSSAAANGVRPGWSLLAIDDSNLVRLIADLRPRGAFQKAAFLAWTLTEHAQRGDVASKARVQFLDLQDESHDLELTRSVMPGETVKIGFFPPLRTTFEKRWLDLPGGGRAGYVRFNFWMLPAAGAFAGAIQEMGSAQGIVIDMRGNLGGLAAMVMGVAGHFVTNRLDLGVMRTRDNELHFYANPRTVDSAGNPVRPYGGPVAILTDEISVSAAELFAGGMQSIGRAKVFGRTSAGQALPATFNQLPNGDLLYHAFADFTLPDGRHLEGEGVRPDVWAPLRRSDLAAGRDAPLEAALASFAGQ